LIYTAVELQGPKNFKTKRNVTTRACRYFSQSYYCD
jgi:hypothetical protein